MAGTIFDPTNGAGGARQPGDAGRSNVHDMQRNDLAQMLDGAVHDLRTPLGAISGWLEVIESEIGHVEGVVGKAVAGLRRAVDEQVRMLQQFSRASSVLHEPFDPARRVGVVDRLLAAAARLDAEEEARIGSLEHLRGRSHAVCIDGGDRLDDGLHVFLRLLAMATVDVGGDFTIDGDDEGFVVHLQSRQHAAESLLAFCNGLNRAAAKRSNMPLPVLWAARTALIDSGVEPGARVARRTAASPAAPADGASAGTRPDAEAKVDMIVWLRIVEPTYGDAPSLPGPAAGPADDATGGPGRGTTRMRQSASPGVAAAGALATASPFDGAAAAGAPGLGSGLDGSLEKVIEAATLDAGLGTPGFATGGLGVGGLAGADVAGVARAASGLGAAAMVGTPQAGATSKKDDTDASGRTILIVDDQKEIREMLALWLRCHQFHVVVAGSAKEARQRLAESGEIQAALIDIRMPDEDGISLLRSIRDRESERGERRMPALAITAQPSTETRTSAIQAGFSGMLAKPLKLRQLIALVANLH